MIWHKKPETNNWQKRIEGTIVAHLGIELLEVTQDTLSARMPVDERTFQPMKILHGGASVVLAETLGSIAGSMAVNQEEFFVVGQSITSNHLRPVTHGWVTGMAHAKHIGKRSQIWDIEIWNEEKKLVNTSRLTLAVIRK
ncbi:MAG TPA: thioesterase [Flavobacteriales bacterium]|jgi:1,4-dihydroxy-2-naphthoyl-CoA hydrolase|nr:thioesterase [Flavobacteriales bacterium]